MNATATFNTDDHGLLIVLSGPSGVGKGTVCARLMGRHPEIKLSVSVTTRAPREGEKEGVSYFYRTKEEFQRMIDADEFLEYMCVFGKNNYGTPRAYVERQRAEGRDVVLEIDVNGALRVKEKCPDAVLIMIAPPSLEELRKRLEGRGTEAREAVERRLAEAGAELSQISKYDYIVINDDLNAAVIAVEDIICAERHSVARNAGLVARFNGGK